MRSQEHVLALSPFCDNKKMPQTKVSVCFIILQIRCHFSRFQGKNTAKKSTKAKPSNLLFSIDCSTPVEDEIMDAGAFVS